jgi:hypothetical protein
MTGDGTLLNPQALVSAVRVPKNFHLEVKPPSGKALGHLGKTG